MRPNIKDRIISKTKYLEHVIRTVVRFHKKGKSLNPVKINSSVIKLPHGGQVIPYFKDSSGNWKVVMVNQYRIPIKAETIEGAGGRIGKNEAIKKALARELNEETGIKINHKAITIIFSEYVAPSLLDASMFGGISKINANMVINKNRMISGKNERTQVEIFDLKNLLKKREEGVIKIDLMTSRLLDELAKTVGLLVRKY
ncbi:MAG: NUDIX domain-containing protein [Parcubacteria group bacterium]|nr:NUDIX domain-containing protein [Parcubacteria group bacterium]